MNSGLLQQEYYKKLAQELEKLVDANGKVKSGYEERVNFILNQLNEAYGTEYKLVNGQIEKYDELKDNIYKTIEAEKAKIVLNANEEAYTNALKNQVKNQEELRKLLEEQNKAQDKYNEKLKEIEENYGGIEEARDKAWWTPVIAKDVSDLEHLQEELDQSKGKVDELKNVIATDNQTIIYWEDLKTATITGNQQEIDEALRNITTTYQNESQNQTTTLSDQLNAEISMANDRKKIWEENGIEINDTRKEQLEAGIKVLADKLAEQTTTVESLTDDQVEAWKLLAESSEQVYNEKISSVEEDTRLVLEALLGKVDITSTEYINRWSKMANESSEKYNNTLSRLPEETQGKILAMTMAVTGMNDSTRKAYEGLSETARSAFNKELSNMDIDAKHNVQSALNEINAKQWEGNQVGGNVGYSINSGFNNNLGNTERSANNWISPFKTKLQSRNPFGIIGLVGSFASSIVQRFDRGLGNASPSKKTRKSANNFMAGFNNNIKKLIPTSLNQVKKLAIGITDEFDNNLNINDIASGFTVNPNSFKIDTTQFIDYGQISGTIATQANVEVNNLPQQVKQAVIEGMSQVSIPVEIEARADEGVIFTKVQAKAREFVMQTGEEPFPSPA